MSFDKDNHPTSDDDMFREHDTFISQVKDSGLPIHLVDMYGEPPTIPVRDVSLSDLPF